MKNITINNLYIEVTRNCTMSCKHCLRGEKQNINLKEYSINKLFNDEIKITQINNLTITGGEPTLNIKIILQIIKKIITNNIIVKKFVLVTNGSIYNQTLVEGLNVFYNYIIKCNNNSTQKYYLICSQDQFHIPPEKQIIKQYEQLPYFKTKYVYLSKEQIINIGRARNNNLGLEQSYKEISLYFELYKINNYPNIIIKKNNNFQVDELYLSAKGLYGFHIIDVPYEEIDELCIYDSFQMFDKILDCMSNKSKIKK